MGRQSQIKKARRICNSLRKDKRTSADRIVDEAAIKTTAKIKGGVRDRVRMSLANVH